MTSERLEYLRGQVRAECISWGEIAELQSLAGEIDPSDVELLEWAGVPEGTAGLPRLDIPADAWRPCGPESGESDYVAGSVDKWSFIAADVTVCGLAFTASGYEVTTDETRGETFQTAVWQDDELGAIHAALHADGWLETVEVHGRPYVVILAPV